MGEYRGGSVIVLPLLSVFAFSTVRGCGRLSLIDFVLQNMFIMRASGSIPRAAFYFCLPAIFLDNCRFEA